jgi:O-acetyl-ADP-ribose deacetylase (regulator of RNase III)
MEECQDILKNQLNNIFRIGQTISTRSGQLDWARRILHSHAPAFNKKRRELSGLRQTVTIINILDKAEAEHLGCIQIPTLSGGTTDFEAGLAARIMIHVVARWIKGHIAADPKAARLHSIVIAAEDDATYLEFSTTMLRIQ